MGKIARGLGAPTQQQLADLDKKYGKGNYMMDTPVLRQATRGRLTQQGLGTPGALKETIDQRANREWGEGNYTTEDYEVTTSGGRKVKNKLYIRSNNLSKGTAGSSSAIEIRRDKRSSFMTSGTTKGTLG
jgi:hypothetical protein